MAIVEGDFGVESNDGFNEAIIEVYERLETDFDWDGYQARIAEFMKTRSRRPGCR